MQTQLLNTSLGERRFPVTDKTPASSNKHLDEVQPVGAQLVAFVGDEYTPHIQLDIALLGPAPPEAFASDPNAFLVHN